MKAKVTLAERRTPPEKHKLPTNSSFSHDPNLNMVLKYLNKFYKNQNVPKNTLHINPKNLSSLIKEKHHKFL